MERSYFYFGLSVCVGGGWVCVCGLLHLHEVLEGSYFYFGLSVCVCVCACVGGCECGCGCVCM